ncbi:hypothetical protein RB594_009283 [Gaeumannomyces avenae]
MPHPTADPTLALPRILCLHGGGVNGDVFRLQMRAVASRLSGRFRLVFADGPFICPAHPAVAAVYGSHGPFRRWLRWLPEHPAVDAETAAAEVHYQLRTAMEDDDRAGATGEWAALLGFSQGAKIAASLLLAQQALGERGVAPAPGGPEGVRWRFGVVMAGRAPLVCLDEGMGSIRGVQEASGIGAEFKDWAETGAGAGDHILRIPTIHVHGLKDPGLELHRRLLNEYCGKESARLVEWDGDHRIPIKGPDVQAVTAEILRLADELGIER